MGSSNDSMKADEANPNPGPENNADTPSAPLLGAHERANAFPGLKELCLSGSELQTVPKDLQGVPSLQYLKFFLLQTAQGGTRLD